MLLLSALIAQLGLSLSQFMAQEHLQGVWL